MRSDNTAPTAADGEHIISMPDGLPGFPDSHSFVLENIDGVGGLGVAIQEVGCWADGSVAVLGAVSVGVSA